MWNNPGNQYYQGQPQNRYAPHQGQYYQPEGQTNQYSQSNIALNQSPTQQPYPGHIQQQWDTTGYQTKSQNQGAVTPPNWQAQTRTQEITQPHEYEHTGQQTRIIQQRMKPYSTQIETQRPIEENDYPSYMTEQISTPYNWNQGSYENKQTTHNQLSTEEQDKNRIKQLEYMLDKSLQHQQKLTILNQAFEVNKATQKIYQASAEEDKQPEEGTEEWHYIEESTNKQKKQEIKTSNTTNNQRGKATNRGNTEKQQ